MHDLQQLAEAAMLQQSREGDGGDPRSNPRRLPAAAAGHAKNAGNGSNSTATTTGNAVDNSNSEASQQLRRTTRQRSARNSAANTAGSSSTAAAAAAPPASTFPFARSPSSRGTAATAADSGNGRGSSNNESSRLRPQSGQDSTGLAAGAPAPSGYVTEPAVPPPSASSAQQVQTGDFAIVRANALPTPVGARSTRRKDKRNSDKKASISSINTVNSSLSATSSSIGTTSSLPALSHAGTHSTADPSISSAASDISSRTSEGTHATTPEHASTGDAVHVLYAKAGQHEYPSYAQTNIPYPVYHQQQPHQAGTSIADGKTGPVYHHIPPPPPPMTQAHAILASNGPHQAQPAYVNLPGRPFDPSQVQLYPHDQQDESRSGSQSNGNGNADDVGIRYFIDPYALPVNHPYHPSQAHSLHSSTPQTQFQHGTGMHQASAATTSQAQSAQNNHQARQSDQHHYASSTPLPPLPGPALGERGDYHMPYSHPQASSSAYTGNASTSAYSNGSGLNGSTSTTATVSTSADNSTADMTFHSLHENKADEEEDQEGSKPSNTASSASATTTTPTMTSTTSGGVPAKKQKGRRPTNLNLESKNHKCKFENCNWSFSRREHLRRHEKTHTQEKPFLCDIPLCGLRFSRLDNLNSHKRTHDKGKRTSQWHVAKVVGAQQAARAGSGSALGEGSEDGRASVDASSSVLRPPTAADQSGIEDSLPPHSAGGSNSNPAQQQHYATPGSGQMQQNGFAPMPPVDSGNMINANSTSTVGAEVRFAYYDPSLPQPPHSSGGPHHPQHSVVGLGGPYGNVRGYQDPFSYSAPPPPPPPQPQGQQHGMPMPHPHMHPSQHQPPPQHHQIQHHQQHSYHHQPLPPLPPSMHDDSAYMHQHAPHSRGHQQPQQSHLQPSGMVNGMPHHQEYDHNVYSRDMHPHAMPQHHMMQHQDHPHQQHHNYSQHMLPPPPPVSSAPIASTSGRNSGSSKRKRNESHRSNHSTTGNNSNNNNNNNNGAGHLNSTNDHNQIVQQIPNQMESPSHKRRQSGRKGGMANV